MERQPIWTLPNANGEQSVFDRVINGLQPREQRDMRSDEVKAMEVAHAMNMLKEGQIVALDHNPLSLPPDDLAAVERAVIASGASAPFDSAQGAALSNPAKTKAPKEKKAGRPKKSVEFVAGIVPEENAE